MTHTYTVGQIITVRDERWVVKACDQANDGGMVLSVEGLSPLVKGSERVFMTRLESKIKVVDPRKVEGRLDTSSGAVSTRLYLESLFRESVWNTRHLVRGPKAAMDLLPFQCAPAQMAVEAPRCRLLIADAVGLGKTIEAGMVLSELMARGRGKRILVLAITSMLGQLQKELWSRFSIPLVRLDSQGIQRIRGELPANYNPFSYYDKTIISIDTLKRDLEYRSWLENSYWDVIVIDEAHNVARRSTKSQRHRLAHRLSQHCDSMILLSATPHDGKKESFASLMNMLNPAVLPSTSDYGPEDIQGLFVRRFKKDVADQLSQSLPQRHIAQLESPLSPEEAEVLQRIARMEHSSTVGSRAYGRRILFATLLKKAFLSSAEACTETVRQRMLTLKKQNDQLYMVKELDELERIDRKLSRLTLEKQTKYSSLITLLTSSEYGWNPSDPNDRLVIFTERIGTLMALRDALKRDLKLKDQQVAVLHGTLPDSEVTSLVEEFGQENSPIRVLIASDMASEGINLHYRCHRLVHFDIPWSLMTFQQRNGRVDRYGQKHEPIISYLLSTSDDPELQGDSRILQVLIEKDRQVQENIGDPCEFTGIYDQEGQEFFTAAAMERRLDPEQFDDQLDAKNRSDEQRWAKVEDEDGQALEDPGLDDDWLDFLSGGSADAQPETKPQEIPSLFQDDYSYYKALVGLPLMAEGLGLQVNFDDGDQVIEASVPAGFRAQLRQLPKEVRPTNHRIALSARAQLVMDQLEQARTTGSWPQLGLLWDQHPLTSWLRQELITALGRDSIPVVATGSLAGGTALLVGYGEFNNQRGHRSLSSWGGVLFADGRVQKVLDLDEALDLCGLRAHGTSPLVNLATTVPQDLDSYLNQGYKPLVEKVQGDRARFEAWATPLLEAERSRLKAVYDKRMDQLELVLGQRADKGSRLAESFRHEREERYEQEMDQFIQWIEDHLMFNPEPYVHFGALIYGAS